METRVEIQTERLILQSVTPAFIAECFTTRSEEEIKVIFGSDEKDFRDLREAFENGLETFKIGQFYFLLHDKMTRKTIGECGFHTWNRFHRKAEVFYKMKDEAFKKKGLMREALPAVLEYGFQSLNLHRVQALIDLQNIPSLRLLQRFGFQREGTMRQDYCVNGVFEDSVCFSLLKHEWKSAYGLGPAQSENKRNGSE